MKTLILPSDLSSETRSKLYAFVDALADEMPELHSRIRSGVMLLDRGRLSFVLRGLPIDHFDRWFWTMIKRSDQTYCWEWQGRRDANGYGVIKIGGGRLLAHRASLMLLGLAVPDMSLHRCDNPPCVSPFHLYKGSYHQNARDRWRRTATTQHQ